MHTPVDGAGRVIFLTSNYPRWAGDTTTPFVRDLAVDLVARGWQVTVLAPHALGAAHRERLDGIDIHRFRYLLPASSQTVCYGGGALVNVREARSNKAKLPALVAAEWVAAARALGAGCDVLHAHWTLPQGFVAATTPYRRVARVLTVHGGDVFGLRGRVLDRFSARTLRGMDQVTVASSATEAAVREIAGAGVHVTRVPIGVDLEREPRIALVEELRRKYRRSGGPLLVFVGRVVEEKGVLDIVDAIARLTTDLPGVAAAIVGAGQHVERVRDAAARLNVAERVHLPGWADPDEVPSWFAAADVVLAPSKVGVDGWTEGQGLSIIEAMAVGRPVIATRSGGIPDTITDDVDGLLVPPADPKALAAAIRNLIGDPDRAIRISRAAAASARGRFDRGVAAERMESIYRSAIDRRSRG